ncbi:hypothetical protein [Clostridium septicum]|uniref:hypothetical protein n=1 Tax=Clostridium septicum TaxID=1504 RepID=UPI00159ECC02|nr:hypothetical protein [Clostridium septicum]
MDKISLIEKENALKTILSIFPGLKSDDVREIIGFAKGLSSARLTEKSSYQC